MLIAMTCTLTDSPMVIEVASTIPDMIDQLCKWVTEGVLAGNVQAQISTACEQENPCNANDSMDELAPILLEPEGMVVYIQNVGV